MAMMDATDVRWCGAGLEWRDDGSLESTGPASTALVEQGAVDPAPAIELPRIPTIELPRIPTWEDIFPDARIPLPTWPWLAPVPVEPDFTLEGAGREHLRFMPNGDIYVRGKLAETDRDVVDGLRAFLSGARPQPSLPALFFALHRAEVLKRAEGDTSRVHKVVDTMLADPAYAKERAAAEAIVAGVAEFGEVGR